jgi:hypothetical protein
MGTRCAYRGSVSCPACTAAELKPVNGKSLSAIKYIVDQKYLLQKKLLK